MPEDNNLLRDLRFSQRCCWRFNSSGIWHFVVGRIFTDALKSIHCQGQGVRKPIISGFLSPRCAVSETTDRGTASNIEGSYEYIE